MKLPAPSDLIGAVRAAKGGVAAGVLATGLAFAVAAGWACLPRADAALAAADVEPALEQDKLNKSGETRVYYSSGSCKNCHVKGFEDASTFICRGTEMDVWQRQDKHPLAFKVLSDERAQRIGKTLGWEVTNKKECLVCHAVWVEDQAGIDKPVSREEGVSCVACHGPDVVVLPGNKRPAKLGWVDTHGSQNQQFREAWRKLSRKVKQDEWGMTDLWDPVKRTQLCASCHIGNVAQSKVVTHEMYAAGHPPLPSFEVVTFSNQMPRHWQYLREKDKKVLDLVMKFSPSEVDLEQTHLLAIGGLVAFRENLQLLAGKAGTKNWPELANYSCYACHHELKSKSWRQERGYAGKPGRPPMGEWSTALAELGLSHAARNPEEAKQLLAELQTRLVALQAVFDAHPFGQPEAVKHKAEELMKWIDDQVKRIEARIALSESKGGYGRDATALMLSRWLDLEKNLRPDPKLAAAARRPVPDFDSARQLTWAFQVLYLETASKHDPKLREKLAKTMSAVAAWNGLDDYLRLTMPPGQTKLEPSYALQLDRIGQYEPRTYFQQMDAVLKEFMLRP